MSVRAKFRCTEIILRERQRNLGYTHVKGTDEKPAHYVDADGNEYESNWENWNQPTVKMCTVTTGSPENEVFYEASPGGTFEIVIANPVAAEFFQCGKEYYFDISVADDAS